MKYDLITILGPTASGKTALAVALAYELKTEIISGDSRQVYRRMDLGTGKDLKDYVVDGHFVPYHLIDIVEPGTKYNLFEYQRDFLKGYNLMPVPENPDLRANLAQKSLPELTEILSSYKELHNTTDVDTVKRAIRAIEIEEYYRLHPTEARAFPEIRSLVIGVDIERDLRRNKITKRLRQRLDEGMIDEIKGLLDEGIPAEDLIYYGLEYKYLTRYVLGELTYEEMFRGLETAIHQFAKRQMTWFRGMERRGIKINWLDAGWPMEQKIGQIKDWLLQ